MRELSATRTRTALAGWAGLVCTLATARIEVPTGPRCNAQPAALTIDWGARSPRAFDGYRSGLQLGDRPGGGKFWPHVPTRRQFGWWPETKSATQRRLFD